MRLKGVWIIVMEVLDREETFIERISKDNPQYRKILDSIVESKKRSKSNKKEIAEIVKEVLSSDAVKIDEENSVTYGEMMVAAAISNTMSNSELGFRDLKDVQSVIGESAENDKAVVINVITNGQDLGD